MNKRNNKGERQDYWEDYYTNGNINYKGNFLNGKRDGYWEQYYYNGKLYYKGNYTNDELTGYWEWYCYNNNGSIIEKEFYL